MEKYWQVTRDGVKPIMCNPEDLKKSDSWLLFHVYKKTIQEQCSVGMKRKMERQIVSLIKNRQQIDSIV